MNNNVLTRRLLIGDAALLREAGIVSGSSRQSEDFIRRLIVDRDRYSYIVSGIDGNFLALAVFIPQDVSMENYRLWLSFDPESGAGVFEKTLMMENLLHKGFFEKNMHKISIAVRTDDHELEEACVTLGMVQEAVLHDEMKLPGGHYSDAGLFACLLPDFKGYNIGFVPFQRGIVAICGEETFIDKVEILRYGDAPHDRLTRVVADYMGLLDEDGNFRKKNSPEYSAIDNSMLPSEVSKATQEMAEYFFRKRSSFDIRYRFREGTDFQRAVWDEVSNIPYGDTVSYEDIAMKLADGDRAEARKLTRAVGAACGDNPVPIIVPCHRVIGKNGKLIGFAQGVDIKDFLLQHESVFMTIL